MHNGYDGGGVGWVGWVAMVAMMIVFWGGVAWVVVTLVRHSGRAAEGAVAHAPDPLRILDERFARGELDEEEYRRRRGVLREE